MKKKHALIFHSVFKLQQGLPLNPRFSCLLSVGTTLAKDSSMKLMSSRNNQTLVQIGDALILFSYETPVILQVKSSGELFVSSEKYSKTTKKHINKFLDGRTKFVSVNQSFFDEIGNKFGFPLREDIIVLADQHVTG